MAVGKLLRIKGAVVGSGNYIVAGISESGKYYIVATLLGGSAYYYCINDSGQQNTIS